VLQRLWLYKTLANTSSMLILSGFYREENHACLLLVCWVRYTNVAGLDNVVALKLDLCTVGVVDVSYPNSVNYCMWAYVTTVVSSTYCGYLRSWSRSYTKMLNCSVKSAWTRYIRRLRSHKKERLISKRKFHLLLHTDRSVCRHVLPLYVYCGS